MAMKKKQQNIYLHINIYNESCILYISKDTYGRHLPIQVCVVHLVVRVAYLCIL